MPLYKVHLNHIYEDDEHVEVEADNEQEQVNWFDLPPDEESDLEDELDDEAQEE